MKIRKATIDDAESITRIYNHFVENAHATMQYKSSPVSFFLDIVQKIQESGHHWLVAEIEGEILGYCYSQKWNPREGYDHTCEISIYLAPGHTGIGLGTQLYNELFSRLEQAGKRSIIAVIGLPNPGSIALHEKFGMSKVAHFNSMGIKFGKWIDVGYWYRHR